MTREQATSSRCCAAATKTVSTSDRLTVQRCVDCGTLWGTHTASPTGRAWDDAYISSDFAEALRTRRRTQAQTVLKVLQSAGLTEPVLDYGAGQGVFLDTALTQNVDVYGCDLDVNAPLGVAPNGRLIQLTESWQIPEGDWGTVVMLDVLEHHADPAEFMLRLKSDYLVLKLPTATGPSARVARVAARLGRRGLLEQLFLVGENFPHEWLATRRGVAHMAQRSGWRRVTRRSVVEVGSELPARMRGASSRTIVRWILAVVGTGLALVGRLWSDSELTVLERA